MEGVGSTGGGEIRSFEASDMFSTEDMIDFESRTDFMTFREEAGVLDSVMYQGDYSGGVMPDAMKDFFVEQGLTLPNEPSVLTKEDHHSIMDQLKTAVDDLKGQYEASGFSQEAGAKYLEGLDLLNQSKDLGDYTNASIPPEMIDYMTDKGIPIPNGDGQGLNAEQMSELETSMGEHITDLVNEMRGYAAERDPGQLAKMDDLMDLRATLNEAVSQGGPVQLDAETLALMEEYGIEVPGGNTTIDEAKVNYMFDQVNTDLMDVVENQSVLEGLSENIRHTIVTDVLFASD